MKFELKGLKETQQKLERLRQNAAAMDGTHEVPLADILSPAFLRQHTRVGSLDELFVEWKVDVAGFKALSDEQKDEFTKASTTSFQTWHDFVAAGAREYTKSQLFK
jgi:hypothetical protein